MHMTAAGLETWGTVLQLAGAIITFGGLVWAWHTASGVLRQWRTALGNVAGRLTRIRDAVHAIIVPEPATITLQGSPPIVPVTGDASGHGELLAVAGPADPTEKRLNDLEHGHEALRDQLTVLDSAPRPEIDNIIKELKNARELHLNGLYFAGGGILVSIAGYVLALTGYLIAC